MKACVDHQRCAKLLWQWQQELHYIILYCIVLYCIILYYIILYYIILYYVILYYIILHYIGGSYCFTPEVFQTLRTR